MISFNISGAFEGMNDSKLVFGKSTGHCARSVRSFIERGGIPTNGRPAAAYQYVDYLPSIGFSPIATLTGKNIQSQWSQQNANVGDISVMRHGQYGHICMWNGNQWVSDFKQNNMWPYNGDGTCFIFRFTGNTTGAVDFSGYGGFGDESQYYSVSYGLEECPEKVEFKGLYNLYRNLTAQYSGNDRTRYDAQGNIVLGGESPGDTGISMGMFNYLVQTETGKHWGFSMGDDELYGKDLGDAKGHKTYGYGSLYFNKQFFMDQVKDVWTQEELEGVFIKEVTDRVGTVKSWAANNGVSLTQGQLDAIVSACYNMGNGFLKKPIARMIINNPNNPEIKKVWAHLSDNLGKKYPGLLTRRAQEAEWYFA